MKQIGIALIQYTQDNDECFPLTYWDGTAWRPYVNANYAAIHPYLKSTDIYLCPSRDKTTGAQFVINSQPYKTSYITNYFMLNADGYNSAKPVKLSMVPAAASIIGIAEAALTTGSGSMNDRFEHVYDPTLIRQGSNHFDGGNFMFLDGHAKWYGKTVTSVQTDECARMWGRVSRTALNQNATSFRYGE
jgi:prepilin-type processing-associated H-X9-DG protein